MMKTLISQLVLILIYGFYVEPAAGKISIAFCVQESDSARLEQKIPKSDIILAGYTRSVHSREAEFLVFNVFKGEDKISDLFKNRKLSAIESALNRKLVNVTGFPTNGPQAACTHGIRISETYLLFVKFVGKVLFLDGSDAIQTYSKSTEDNVRKVIALTAVSTNEWGEWSTCSKSCDGGMQTRVRPCSGKQACSSTSASQMRSCNTFPCIGLTDVLNLVGLKQTLLHPGDRPAAYRLINKASWTSTAALPATRFPTQFSVMVSVRATKEAFSGFLFRVFQNERDIQLAVHLSEDTVSLVMPEGHFLRFKQKDKLQSDRWYWMSFSVRRNTVTFFLDCKPSGVSPIDIKTTYDPSKQLEYVVGSLSNKDRTAFQGDVEQIMIAEAASAAAEQCSIRTQSLDTTGSSRHGRVRNPVTKHDGLTSSSTKVDDEDFDFSNGDDGSANFYDDEYDDVEDSQPKNDIKKAVLLLSESPTKDDDEDYDENHDFSNFLLGKKTHSSVGDDDQKDTDDDDYDEDDDEEEETGSDDNEEEGSGSSPTTSSLPPAIPEWSTWSECSRTCDWGVRTRTMTCAITDDDDINDIGCLSLEQQKQSEPCFKVACPTTTPMPTTTKRPPVTTTEASQQRVKTQDFATSWKTRPWMKNHVTSPAKSTWHLRTHSKFSSLNLGSCKPDCQNGGTCSVIGKCICKKGFLGRYCEKAACVDLCENGGTCAQHGRCLCLPGFYGIRCEFRKCDKLVSVKRPYEKSFKKKVVKEEKFPCGAWGWKKCTRTKLSYAPVFQTFYRTEYVCESENSVLSID